jgi:hypothetical protein
MFAIPARTHTSGVHRPPAPVRGVTRSTGPAGVAAWRWV